MSQYQSLVADYAVAVVPSDVTAVGPTLGLYVGGTGNVTVTMKDGTVVVFNAVPVGAILPVRCVKVNAATTATLIVALW